MNGKWTLKDDGLALETLQWLKESEMVSYAAL